MSFLLNRMVRDQFLTETWRENMRRIEDCTGCGYCKENCPYGIDAPELLRYQYGEYVKEVKG